MIFPRFIPTDTTFGKEIKRETAKEFVSKTEK